MSNIKEKYRQIEGKVGIGTIRILEEKYKNVVVGAGKVTFDDTSENHKSARMSYEYDVIELPPDIELDDEFHNLLGDIIVDIIETTLETNPELLKFEESEENDAN
jgi:hypothetical protein|tara:strand:+ start:57 stop:371 length:315 start_codon:yes stop_codon:yes gene_type:complete